MKRPARSSTTPTPRISRRSLLLSLPGAAIAARAAASARQANGRPLPVARLHGFGIRVSDPARTLDFYQGLFGMPVQATRGERIWLRIGDGPRFMSVGPVGTGESPSISHICMSVPGFDAAGLLASLARMGISEIEAPSPGAPGIETPMRSWVRTDGDGPELYFADARGLVIQLQDPAYCGGTGPLGSVCETTPSALEPRIALSDLSHFTVFVSDGAGANAFYADAMGFAPQAYQAATPAMGVGDGIQFLMFAGGGGRGGGVPVPANINHASFNMERFETDPVLEALTGYGLTASQSNTGPLVHYVSLRMPNRGGAEGGTPELYFTDPDGLLMQIQDTSYCGGGGVLGNVCEV